MLDRSTSDERDFVASVSEYSRVIEERLACDRIRKTALYKPLAVLTCLMAAMGGSMWLFTHLPVSLIAADPAQAAEDAKHVADCLRLMPYMFFCTTVTWLLFLVNACSEASLNIFDQADRNLIEHFLLPHRARLSSHPDAQRVFAAYDATQRISLRSALIRGPTVLTSSY